MAKDGRSGALVRKFPFDFIPLRENAQIQKDFLGYTRGLVQCQPEGWIFGGFFTEHAERIYNMEVRDNDVWIVSYPKSGTTWMQQIVWFLLNNFDYHVESHIDVRSPFIDFDMCIPKEKFRDELDAKKEKLLAENPKDPTLALTVYVARDPRDVVVSYFHHHRLIRHHEFVGDFKAFFHYFIQEKVLWSPYWRHISQAWKHRKSDNLLFVFFSDMKEDLSDVVDRLCAFLKVSLTHEEKETLLDHLNIKNMRANASIDDTEVMIQLGLFKENEGSFIRKGKSGGWKDYFDDEMIQEMEVWKERNCKLFDVPIEKLWK
ncbi:hypothetical protein TCAL_16218 [Tigriopus californicus]|uniref:Sulfotransferase domain-containing protein n=1 Tax=Tigriopus californicus TaxID=6832 RepID=A0A553P2J4_TIGCA|nr:hypothetical protein TCAL_16218 [Tigriopus californicus]|eukprot:TCALIF_01069-PB protein Name:"Similar to sult1st1 Cytosolic sulfotransferase 1 (Danio rerio)" AED:0.23 eAED:0.23 QI:84/0.8/0.83/1/0/0.33/6/887/316